MKDIPILNHNLGDKEIRHYKDQTRKFNQRRSKPITPFAFVLACRPNTDTQTMGRQKIIPTSMTENL